MIFRSKRRGYSPGTITVLRLGRTRLVSRRGGGKSVEVQHDQYIWKAPRSARGALPRDRSIIFDVFTADDNIRRFVPRPEDGCSGYVARAFQYGHSLLARDLSFDWPRWCEYLVAKHAFDRLEHVQERIKCLFGSTPTLGIRKKLQPHLGFVDVLPEDFGLPATGSGRPWSVAKLIEEGQRAAARTGLERPSRSDVIACGLAEAAKQNPLQLTEAEAETMVRMSLYDFSRSGPMVPEETCHAVWQRFHDWIREHLHDEREDFKKRLFGGHNNLVNLIAQRAAACGEKLPRPVIKRALHDLGWRGYELVAECLEAFAQSFTMALAKHLSDEEQAYFRAMYFRQSYFGGLPLVLLMERSSLIKPMILELWEDPNNEGLIGGLHQLLRCYAEMVPKRRQADRLAKKKPSGRRISEEHPEVQRLMPVAPDQPSLLEEVAQDLIERRGTTCPACLKLPHGTLALNQGSAEPTFSLAVMCQDHGPIETVTISAADIESIKGTFVN